MKKMIEYLEEDRERVFSGLQSAASPEAAQMILEKEADRLLLQYNEDCTSVRIRDAASGMMQALRSSVPFLDSMGEARVWRTGRGSLPANGSGASGAGAFSAGAQKAQGTGLSGILLAIGAVLTAAAFFVPALAAGGTAVLPALLRGILLPAAGSGCLYLAGRTAGKNTRIRIGNGSDPVPAEERIEITVDPEKLWNSLRGAVMVVDRNLEIAQESEAYDRHRDLTARAGANGISAEEIELFSGLLEQADADSPQMAEDIRYYLHKKNVDVLSWSPVYAAWFEILPGMAGPGAGVRKDGAGSGNGYVNGYGNVNGSFSGNGSEDPGAASEDEKVVTIRPALAQGGKLLKKGIAVR